MRIAVVAAVSFGLCCRAVAQDEWPGNGLVVAEGTSSPDGKYGIVVPSHDAASDVHANENHLGDLIAHRLLGKIPESDYFDRQNHADLNAVWSADSSWCAAVYLGRFGFGECLVLEPHGDRFITTIIGKEIQKTLDGVVQKRSHVDDRPDVQLHLRPRPNRTLQVRALGSTNPKQIEGEKTYYAYFVGTYDLNTKRWTKLRAREGNEELAGADSAFDSAEGDLVRVAANSEGEQRDGFNGSVVPNEKTKAEVLDRMLNEAYAAVRITVAPARFAKLKEEQRAWLQRRDKEASLEAKNKMTEARVQELRASLWEE